MKTITKLITVLAVWALSVDQSKADHYGELPPEVTGEMSSNQPVFQPGVAPTINFMINRPLGKTNNGHGNNVDGVDSSNPGNGGGGPNDGVDQSSGTDDEIKGGSPAVNLALGPNMIRQIDLDTGITMDVYSNADFGSFVAGMPVTGPIGAMFELWVEIGGVMTHIDTIFIGPYMPTATLLVTSPDPWQRTVLDPVSGSLVPFNIYRTRADIPFTVAVTAGALSADPALPLAARAVSLEVSGANGDPITYILGGEYPINSVDLTAASPTYTWTGKSQLSPFADPDFEIGQQHFSMRTYPDVIAPSWQVGRATVVIWPKASAAFSQFTKNLKKIESFADFQTFYGDTEDILVNYTDLYPESNTYVQMYKGPYVAGTVGVPISVTEIDLAGSGFDVPQNSVPQGIKMRSVDLEEVINIGGNGVYTLEVITGNLSWINGGAYETVEHINFTIARSVSINGTIGTN